MRMEAGTVPQIPVLGYHHVHDGPDDFFRASPELLHQQMEILLAEGYTPIGPARLIDLAGQTADDRYVWSRSTTPMSTFSSMRGQSCTHSESRRRSS